MKLINGDSLEVLKGLEDNLVDAIVSELEKYYIINSNGSVYSKKLKKNIKFALTYK